MAIIAIKHVRMILGISSFTYGWAIGVPGRMPAHPMTEHDLLDRMLQFDLRCLQIGDNLPLHEFTDIRLAQLKERLNPLGVRFEVGANGMTAEHLSRYIAIAADFGAPLLRFVVDRGDYAPPVQEIIRIIKNALPELISNNVKLGIENHDRLKARELAFIMDAVDSEQVGVCLDCVNSMGAGEGLEHVLNALAPYTINLHIKDFNVTRLPHKMGFTVAGAVAGTGMTDLPMILRRLTPRCESAVLEQWVVPEEDIEKTIQKEKQWAERGIEYLRTLAPFHSIKQH